MSALAQPVTDQTDDAPEADSEAMPVAAMDPQVIADALIGVVGKLQGLADKQVQLKQAIEQRWLDDMRQFHGRYPVATEEALKKTQKSSLFVNLTRAKVNSWEARLSDLLFPTDDKNWGIAPTPAPQLPAAVTKAMNAAKAAAAQATAAHQGGNPAAGAAIAAQGTAAAQQGASIQDVIDEAAKRCGLMEAEIDTQLKDSEYNIRCRAAIRDAIKLGTGVMKGPITSQKMRRSWIPASQAGPAPSSPANDLGNIAAGATSAAASGAPSAPPQAGDAPDPTQNGSDPTQDTTAAPDPTAPPAAVAPAPAPGAAPAPTDLHPWKQPNTPPADVTPTSPGTAYVLDQQPDPAPEFVWVDPWSFFPDMSARTPNEAEFNFERHLWNAKQLRAAVKTTGLDPVACSDLLREKPSTTIPTYWAQLREITSNSSIIGMEARYQVWEFHGVLEDEDLQTIAAATGDLTIIQFVKDNPLLEVPIIMWFCEGHMLKFAPYPLDSGESLYSVVNFEPDDTSMFGFGCPYLMHDSQSALNGGWRMMMDNGGLSVGPQIVIDGDAVKPQDGNWGLRPMKVWLKSGTSLTKLPDAYKPFDTFNIQANQVQLQAIIEMAQGFIDTETSMPLIAAGGEDAHMSRAASGISMILNSANVVFRRVVKNFDDCISTPNIRRMYDWNMQFSKRDDIKGDFAVDARGSSVLLVKEQQAQTLMSTLQNFSNHPIVGPMLKVPPIVRKLFASQMIHADDVVKSDDVIAQEAAERAQQSAQADPAVQQLQMKLASAEKIATDRTQAMLQVADRAQQTALITLAQTHNMSLDDLQTQLQINQNDIQHRERIFAAELAQASVKPPTDFAGPGIAV